VVYGNVNTDCVWQVKTIFTNRTFRKWFEEGGAECALLNCVVSGCCRVVSVVDQWIVEPWFYSTDSGKGKTLKINPPTATLAVTDLTWACLRSNLGLRYARPPTNRLSHGMVTWRLKTSNFYIDIFTWNGTSVTVWTSSNDLDFRYLPWNKYWFLVLGILHGV
jgi:hypothetical protein